MIRALHLVWLLCSACYGLYEEPTVVVVPGSPVVAACDVRDDADAGVTIPTEPTELGGEE